MVTCNLVTYKIEHFYETPIWSESNKYITYISYYLFKGLFQYHKATEPQYKHQQLPKSVIGH